jgi:hypothetical protein
LKDRRGDQRGVNGSQSKFLTEFGICPEINPNPLYDTNSGQRTGTKILIRALHEPKQSNISPALSNAHESDSTSSVTCCITEGKIKTATAHTAGGGAEPQRERKELRREAAACGIREP